LLSYSLALDLPKLIALFVIQPIFERKISQIIKNNTNISIVGNILLQNSSLVLSFTNTCVSISGFFNPKSFIESFFGNTTISLFIFSIPLSTTVAQE
jgi:hypothetical protein